MNTKPKTTITKTTTGVTEFVEHSTDIQLTPMPNTGRPYVLESDEFNHYVLGKRSAAAREIDEIDQEIRRLHIEIEARLDRRKDLMNVVIRADAALNFDASTAPRPSPQLTERVAE